MAYWLFMFNLAKYKKILFRWCFLYGDALFSAELHPAPFLCMDRDIYIHLQRNIFKHIKEKIKHLLDWGD